MGLWTSSILRFLTFSRWHILSSARCDVWNKYISSCQCHSFILFIVGYIIVLYICLSWNYIFQFRRFDREKLHTLCDQSWTILSKQPEIPKNAEWRILRMVWSSTSVLPPGNFSVISDENPMSCDVAYYLMFNLRLHTLIRQTASKVLEPHPLELSLCSPQKEQFSSPLEMPIFIYWVCLFWVESSQT